MKQPRLSLYTIDLKYIRNLAKVDDNVLSISPQVGKSTPMLHGKWRRSETHMLQPRKAPSHDAERERSPGHDPCQQRKASGH